MPTRKAIPNRANRPTGTDPVAVQRRIKRFVSLLTLLISHSLTILSSESSKMRLPSKTDLIIRESKVGTSRRHRPIPDFP